MGLQSIVDDIFEANVDLCRVFADVDNYSLN